MRIVGRMEAWFWRRGKDYSTKWGLARDEITILELTEVPTFKDQIDYIIFKDCKIKRLDLSEIIDGKATWITLDCKDILYLHDDDIVKVVLKPITLSDGTEVAGKL